MFIYGKKTMTQISMCSRNKHMSTGGGAKCAVSETIRNNALLTPACNFIMIFKSQAF